MKENFDQFDNTLRGIAENYSKDPPEKTWRHISVRMFRKDLFSFNFRNYQFRFYLILFLLLVLGSIGFWEIYKYEHPVVVNQENNRIEKSTKEITAIQKQENIHQKTFPKQHIVPEKKKYTPSVTNNSGKVSGPDKSRYFSDPDPILKDDNLTKGNTGVEAEKGNDLFSGTPLEGVIDRVKNDMKPSGNLSIASIKFNELNVENPGTSVNKNSIDFTDEVPGRSVSFPLSFAVGLFISQEKADNTIKQDKYFHGNTPEVMLELRKSGLFLRTGLGITESIYKYGYSQNYSKSEVVGAYYRLDSVNASLFTDTIQNKTVMELHYYTTLIAKYDTIKYSKEGVLTARYMYINIPVVIGYRKHFSKLGIYAGAGPVLSFLNTKKQDEINIVNDNTISNDITYQKNDVIRFFWQLQLLAGLEYMLSQDVSIAAEPFCKYYDNSFIKNTGYASNQLIFGFRYGLIWHIR